MAKIALHIYSMAGGGAERATLVLAIELQRRGFEVDLVLCEASGAYMDQIPPQLRVVDLKSPRTFNSIVPLMRYMRTERPLFFISEIAHQNVTAIIANRLAGRPTRTVVVQQNLLSASKTRDWKSKIIPALYRLTLPFADRVLGVSSGVADDMARCTGYPRARIGVVNNPAYPEDLEILLAEPVDDPFFDADQSIIVAAGRLNPQKAYDILLPAFALLRKNRAARLAILGVGELEPQLRAMSHALGLDDDVKFAGFQRNPIKFMNRADLFVLSSRFEGFGNVIVEALACGTPVASTDCPYGPAEILAGGAFGELCPINDIEGMAAAMERALSKTWSPAQLNERARTFCAANIADKYLEQIQADAFPQ